MRSTDEVIRFIQGAVEITHYRYVSIRDTMEVTVVTDTGMRLDFVIREGNQVEWVSAADASGDLPIPANGIADMPEDMVARLTERLFNAIFAP